MLVEVFAVVGESQIPEDARSETLDVQGLNHPVEILKDRWGISHIYAETEYDLFFGQGAEAGELAGRTKHLGELYFLLPK